MSDLIERLAARHTIALRMLRGGDTGVPERGEGLEIVYVEGPYVVPVGIVFEGALRSLCRRCSTQRDPFSLGRYSFNGEHGVCLRCEGTGAGAVTSALVLARRGAKKAEALRARDDELAAAARERQHWMDQHRDVVDFLEAYDGPADSFLGSLARRLEGIGPLSERQVSAVRKIIADRAAPKAAAAPCPEGRITVEGRILSSKDVLEMRYGSLVTKIVVLNEQGWRVYGTCPAAVARPNPEGPWTPLRGRVIRFDAQVTRSDRDADFGFFKRPTKPAVLDYGTPDTDADADTDADPDADPDTPGTCPETCPGIDGEAAGAGEAWRW